jgi:aspartyl/asparaginyl-tRNA synthetase
MELAMDLTSALLLLLLLAGAAVCASGQLVASPGAKQAVELKADKLTLVGGCDAESYPLQKVRWQGCMLCYLLRCVTLSKSWLTCSRGLFVS